MFKSKPIYLATPAPPPVQHTKSSQEEWQMVPLHKGKGAKPINLLTQCNVELDM